MLSAQAKNDRCQQILLQFLNRRSSGEAIEPQALAAQHPELMPELLVVLAGGLKMLREVITTSQPPMQVRGYAFKREINRGGQGIVFEAIQESTGQRVAIKVIQPLSRYSVARFEREIAALASIKHPGVVGIIDCGRMTDGAFYLVMEFVDGEDFDAWIELCKTRRTQQKDLIAMFAAICDAVAAAHRLGIIHRDLKPTNIRIDTSGRPRIIDFGLATIFDDLSGPNVTQTGNIVGSVSWASPEQVRGSSKEVTAASDVYSLGVIFYHAFSGHYPYQVHGTLIETAKIICESKPRSLGSAKSLPFGPIPRFLDAILLRCLAKSSGDRLGDAALLASAIRDARLPFKSPSRRFQNAASFTVAALVTAVSVWGGWIVVRPDANAPSELAQPLPVFQNQFGMRFRTIPAGRYRIGSRFNEPGRKDDEREQVTEIPVGLRMAETEVTVGEYRQVMSLPAVEASDARLPVDSVSWDDAQNFCEQLSALDGRHYRLPTESEWEVCCRAGSATPFAVKNPSEAAWSKERSGGVAHPVATLSPNAWGLFDFHGNVAEWTLETEYGYSAPPTTAPDSIGYGLFRVVRGGSFSSTLNDCRSASRHTADATQRRPGIGFRVLIDK